jgi:hypothetical protein
MSRKYIGQLNKDNFVYPNYRIAEYDTEIIHDLKENPVTGSISGVTITPSGTSINVTFSYNWNLNGAEPFISDANKLNVLSVHLMTGTKQYFKPWVCIGYVDDANTAATTASGTKTITVLPSMLNQTSFTNGTYYLEFRLMSKRQVLPVLAHINFVQPSPTPTPSASAVPPGASPTATPTLTPTKTPADTPTVTQTPTNTPSPGLVYYILYNCTDNLNYNSVGKPYLTFSSGDRVVDAGSGINYVISGGTDRTTNPGGALINITATGLYGCPGGGATPTPTPSLLPTGIGVYTGGTYSNSTTACAGGGYLIRNCYIGPGDTLSNGDIIYTDNALNFPFSGNSQYYVFYKDSNKWAGQISAGGYVSNLTVCGAAPSPTPTPSLVVTPDVQFYLTLDPGNSGTLDIYTNGTLSATLDFDGASTAIHLNPGDTFYTVITQTARGNSGQRGQITINDNGVLYEYTNTTSGPLPKSKTSSVVTVVAGHAYVVYGLCGTLI